MNTKEKILTEAVRLFAQEGFDAVTVEMIAAAVGIKAPSLYKHFKSKQDIFESILQEMERRDAENAEESGMPEEPLTPEDADGKAEIQSAKGETAAEYKNVDVQEFLGYCRKMFRYWTEDEFASAFRRMLTVEQYRSPEMNRLYHQYLGSGPLGYTADIVGSEESALALYGPMFMLYSIYDSESEKNGSGDKDKVFDMLDAHLNAWYSTYCK